nr:putative ribonuclease H-like domain-containing protein [Tanacetum cinerariifolium]
MCNTNNNMQTQTSSALHNDIMEAGGKDRPPMFPLGINNDIYSIVEACLNTMEMWKEIERLKQEPKAVVDDEASSKEKEIDKLMALISIYFKKIYKPTNNNLRTSSNTRNINVDNSLISNRGTGMIDRLGSMIIRGQLMLLELGKCRYSVILDVVDNSGPIFDTKPLQKVHNSDDDYNVFANKRQHSEIPKSVNDLYLVEQGDTNITFDSSYMSNNGEEAAQDDQMLQKERKLLSSLIEQMKIKIDGNVKNLDKMKEKGDACIFVGYSAQSKEPNNIKEYMVDHAWIEAKKEELHQFERLEVWKLVDKPLCKNVINMKWLLKNKRDEENTVILNRAHLVAKGYNQIDVKTTFLKGHLKEEVYVNKPNIFVDPHHPNKVYHLKKAPYGLKHAPRAWYDELSNFLVSKGFSKGSIDPTLFITKFGEDISLVQIYVDDIIFRSRNPKHSKKFEKLMHSKFEMSMIGGTEILTRNSDSSILTCIGTPMATKPLDADLSGTPFDQTKYLSMVGFLMYLKASRPDIVHAVCYYARYQVRPTEKHLVEDYTLMSIAEAEFVSLFACCAQVIWMQTQLTDYGFHFDKIPITKYQLADLFTKALSEDRFKYLIGRLGMRCLILTELEALANESV